jgi:aurora kinase
MRRLSKKRLSSSGPARRLSRGPPSRRQSIDPPLAVSPPQNSLLSPVESHNEQDDDDETGSVSPAVPKRKFRRLSGRAKRVVTPDSSKKRKEQEHQPKINSSTARSIALRGASSSSSSSSSSSTTTTTTNNPTTNPATTTTTRRNWSRSDFNIGSALGRGKYGYVYAAVETGSRRQVALKVQPKLQLTNSAAAILQLQREVQIHSRLHHQNICGLWGYMHDVKHCYMVLEKCDNGHLYDELIRQNKFDNATSVFYTKQLIAALQYCHDRHVIHRDIKLENMLLHGNTLKLADFGWAVHVPGKHDGARLTLCGSPAYVSPEIVEGRPHGHWTDLWSVGVVAYEMLHGTPPFEAATERGIFDRIRCVDLIFPEAAVVMKRRGRRSVGKEDVEDEVQDGGHGKDGSNEGGEMMRVPADANNRAREMIQGLLSYEPKERWSLEKCLQSMWMS